MLVPEAWQSYKRGDLARAEQLCRLALASDPDDPAVLNLLGYLAYRAGKLDSAISWMRQAIQADPGNAVTHNDLGAIYLYAGQMAQAAECFQIAVRLRQANPEAFNNLCFALCGLGRFEEALACGQQALRLRPNNPQANNHVGLALLELQRFDEAEEQFRTALRVQPTLVQVHRNLGRAVMEQGRLVEAVACFERALIENPEFAEAHCDLADVFAKLGRLEDAVAQLRMAARTSPDNAAVWLNLAHFGAQGLYQFSDQDLAHVQLLLENQRLTALDQAALHRALADVLDMRASFDAAFFHFRQANSLKLEWLHQSGRTFDGPAHGKMIDGLIADFNQDFFRGSHVAASSTELPVFVIGMPRSGTTLVEQILASHSQVAGAGELRDLSQLAATLGRTREPGKNPLDDQNLKAMAQRYLASLTTLGTSTSVRIVDKMPHNFMHLGLIALLFPKARVIHCRRDPLDVCLSCYFQNFKEINYASSLEDLGLYYREYERLMAHWQRVLPLRMLDIRYEDLVANQELTTRELINVCGLAWEDRCLAFHKNPRPVQTLSALQVRRPIFRNSVGRWKNYAAHLEPVRKALGLEHLQSNTPGHGRLGHEELASLSHSSR